MAQQDRNIVVDAWRPSVLFEIGTAAYGWRQYSRMCSNSHHQYIRPDHRIYEVRSNVAAVKQGKCSPISLPFNQTAIPNCALAILRMAFSRRAGTSKRVRYQKLFRSW